MTTTAHKRPEAPREAALRPLTKPVWTDVTTGPRLVLAAEAQIEYGDGQDWRIVPFLHDGVPYVVPAGQRFVVTGISGWGATVMNDSLYTVQVEVSGGGRTEIVFLGAPVPVTTDALAQPSGGAYAWHLAEPLSFTLAAGEHADLQVAVLPPAHHNDFFKATLVGYLVTTG